jgi:hypothetical protein
MVADVHLHEQRALTNPRIMVACPHKTHALHFGEVRDFLCGANQCAGLQQAAVPYEILLSDCADHPLR